MSWPGHLRSHDRPENPHAGVRFEGRSVIRPEISAGSLAAWRKTGSFLRRAVEHDLAHVQGARFRQVPPQGDDICVGLEALSGRALPTAGLAKGRSIRLN